MQAVEYKHKVHYYETDQMGVVHHSNYIRWMEEARVHYFKQVGLAGVLDESNGVICPVINVNCDYKKMTRFDEEITVRVKLTSYKGVRMRLHYDMFNSNGDLCTQGDSAHTLLDGAGIPVRLKRDNPALHEALLALCEPNTPCLPEGR